MISFLVLDEISVFVRGLVLGIVIAAPVGPVGLLCMKRTLQNGMLTGFSTGFGAAFADAFYGAIAAFGVTAALSALTGMEKEIRFFGGLFLLALAITMLMKKIEITRNAENKYTASGLIAALASGFLITISNPLTIIGVLALVATFAGKLEYIQAASLTGGIFCGSLCWWLLLCGGVRLIRHRFSDNAINWANRITAILLLILSAWAIFTGVAAEMGIHLRMPQL
jgi:threonine/homoserine/homoserine lactone efflux protein